MHRRVVSGLCEKPALTIGATLRRHIVVVSGYFVGAIRCRHSSAWVSDNIRSLSLHHQGCATFLGARGFKLCLRCYPISIAFTIRVALGATISFARVAPTSQRKFAFDFISNPLNVILSYMTLTRWNSEERLVNRPACAPPEPPGPKWPRCALLNSPLRTMQGNARSEMARVVWSL